MLKNCILRKEEGGNRTRYKVNFDPKLKVIIREAKFFDRIGKSIPDTIINIALQEKDYARHTDQLNQLIRNYDAVLDDLLPIEVSLLQRDIDTLNSKMRKGAENHNWFSLSIPEYIEECSKAINKFEQTKGSVISQAKNLQKKVVKIEQSILIRPLDQKQQAMSLQEFSDFFDQYRVKKIAELVRDYQEIGNVYLKTIEQVAF